MYRYQRLLTRLMTLPGTTETWLHRRLRASALLSALWLCAGGLLSLPAAGQTAEAPHEPVARPAAAADRAAEFNVKGVYLYNFARYIEWPDHPQLSRRTFDIGIVGDSGIVYPLQKLAQRRTVVDKRRGTARKISIRSYSRVEDCRTCHMLFIADTVSEADTTHLRQRFAGLPVVIVGETAGFAISGGTIEFLLLDGGVRFRLNVDDARRRRLKTDAKLLTAAHEVLSNESPKTVEAGQRNVRNSP